jgi:PASTA domain
MPDPAPNAQPGPAAKRKANPVVAIVFAVLVVIGIVNYGDDEPAGSADDPAAAALPEAGVETDTALPADGAEVALPGDGLVETAVVPDVVGLNHQLAQDTLQASGFYLLLEQDATGQGRMLLYDRNWEVVAQSVPAGTTASPSEPVTLSARKIGE